MLALRHDPAIDPAGWWVSEKLDGVRASWDGKVLRFRSGRTLPAPAWFLAALPPVALDGERLARFLRNPVKTFFRERLSVSFWSPQQEPGDTEAFGFDGLQQYQLLQQQIQAWRIGRCDRSAADQGGGQGDRIGGHGISPRRASSAPR